MTFGLNVNGALIAFSPIILVMSKDFQIGSLCFNKGRFVNNKLSDR
ncbi:MAG: hypothetical protein ACFCBU_05730 [Cyanophyceae cyanobacterium]